MNVFNTYSSYQNLSKNTTNNFLGTPKKVLDPYGWLFLGPKPLGDDVDYFFPFMDSLVYADFNPFYKIKCIRVD